MTHNDLFPRLRVAIMRGRLIVEKFVVEAIPVYYMSLMFIPKGILEKVI